VTALRTNGNLFRPRVSFAEQRSLSPVEKVKLFRQLFRGREDLYPTRFVSKKTGKSGYAPACSNKFATLLPRNRVEDRSVASLAKSGSSLGSSA
jgi:hypothetical protein